MSKRYSKTKSCAVLLGKKPYKVQYDSKKMLTGTAIPSEQMSNYQYKHNRLIRRLQG